MGFKKLGYICYRVFEKITESWASCDVTQKNLEVFCSSREEVPRQAPGKNWTNVSMRAIAELNPSIIFMNKMNNKKAG